MCMDTASLTLLADLGDRGLIAPGGTAAILGTAPFAQAGFGELLCRLGIARALVLDSRATTLPTIAGLEIRLISQDPGQPLADAGLEGQCDLVVDLGVSQNIFNVVECWRSIHRLCRPGSVVVTRQPMFGGQGLFNFIPEYFEDIAALNDYQVAFSAFVVDGCFVPLSSRLDQAVDVRVPVDLAFALRRTGTAAFRLPYQNVSVRDAYGIAGFSPSFDPATLSRGYRQIEVAGVSDNLSARAAIAILTALLFNKIRRLLR